jgi:short-subunit dehydrogenase
MPAQSEIDADASLVDGTVTDSFTGPARFLQTIAPLMEQRGGGTVVGVGSVAGDRGRIGNYVYGAAKAGFHTYLSGLRNRLTRAGGHVVTVKPGFVDTAMTWGLPGMFLVATPDMVARDILTAVEKKRNVIYTPFFWRYIMLIIRSIPEPIFKKLSV